MTIDAIDVTLSILKIAIVLLVLLNVVPVMVWIERRGGGLIQDRPGPNRVGPLGLLQSFADALKFILKEDVIPAQAHKVLYTLAPMFGLIPALTTIAVVPWGRAFVIPQAITYSNAMAGVLIAVAVLLFVGAALAALATSRYAKGNERIPLTIWVGRIAVVALAGIGLLLLGVVALMKALGSVSVPAAGRVFHPIIADVNIGILFVFALASLGVYGLATAGWSSNNKYSLLGGIRASAQMISYELALTLAAIGCLMGAGSLRLMDVVARQTGYFVLFDTIKIPAWNILPMFIGFVVFFVAAFAETNRLPFDFPEAEAELVAGYHTEYSSMKFAMFFMSEYIAMTTISALVTTLFLGGWDIPWYQEPPTVLGFVLSAIAFISKVAFLLFIFVWVRWTVPRLKYDQLMKIGWKFFLPLAVLNIVIVAFLIALRVI
jgi:NADH-quinone oxidoreductase subunit H